MNRMKLTLLMGACFLLCCLAGKTNTSEAAEKKAPVKPDPKLITCVCKQVPLGPIGGNLWAWMAYRYQYETNCAAATAVSIIEYSEYTTSYPETLCVGSGNCGDQCQERRKSDEKKSKGEPVINHYLHTLPASQNSKVDLYPPQTKYHYEIVQTRYLKFKDERPGKDKYAKVFFLCVSESPNPTEQPDAVYFWYGFEIEPPTDVKPITLPYGYATRRADYQASNSTGGWSQGKCGHFGFLDYGGSQYLIRFK